MTDDAADDSDLIRESAARFATQSLRFGLLDRAAPDHAGYEAALVEGAWTSMRVPEAEGGSGLSTYDLCVVAEEFGRKLLPSLATRAAALSVLGMASDRRRDVRARAIEGKALILPALQSEGPKPSPGHGGKVTRDADGGVTVTGSKHFVPEGDRADGFIMDARCDGALILLFTPRELPGVTISAEPAVDGVSLARVDFNNVKLPADCVIVEGAAAEHTLDKLRFAVQLGLAAELMGAASEAFDRTLDFMRARRQFGRSIGAFQALQHRAVDACCEIELSRALVLEAARVADMAKPGTLELIAGARARAGESALAVAKWAVQMHGAMGFTEDCDIGLFVKRIMVLTRVYRAPDAHRRRFADASASADAVNLFELFRSDSEDDARFRHKVRAFLDAELPERLCDLPTRPAVKDALWWHNKLHQRGWIAPAWPKEHGGMEASVTQRLILFEEYALKGAPELSSQAIYHIGPIIIRFGTPEQKARHLPGILDGSLMWCQGYSEPNSGSDLASLRTRARLDGEKLIVNGSKIWTTGGHHANWMFALVRTNPDAADRRNGISMILIDMASKGIATRAIRTIAGDDEFTEVFFDDVEVPLTNVVGALNDGWKLANAVLETERLISSTPQKVIVFLDRVRRVARETGAIDDLAFRDRLARAEIDVLAFSAAFARLLDRVKLGQTAGKRSSLLKIVNADLLQRLADLLFEAAGSAGANLEPMDAQGRSLSVGLSFLQSRRATIYGGTSEIQRNIVARWVLDLGNDKERPARNERF